jgi:hypothetical protein
MPDDDLTRIALASIASLRNRLAEVLAQEYPTNSAEVFIQIVDRLLTELHTFLLHTVDRRLQQYCCRILRIIGSHIRYIESANSSRVPAQLIAPVEDLIGKLQSKAIVVLRVQWSFNYSVFDIIENYRRMLQQLLGQPILDQVFGPVAACYIVGVPSIERSSVLLHATLGHEIGHRLATSFLNAEDQKPLLSAVLASMGDLTWHHPKAKDLPPLFKFPLRQQLADRILKVRRRALEELIPDIVGYRVFGLSAIFALHHLALSDVLDALPAEQTRWYPPWRLRLRSLLLEAHQDKLPYLISTFDGPDPLPNVRQAALQRIEILNNLVTDTSDWTAVNGDPFFLRAYADVVAALEQARTYVTTQLSGVSYTSALFRSEVSSLITRLALGIPPDELNDGRTPDFRSAIAAGWLYRLARLPIPYPSPRSWRAEDDETLNRLVLKAVESIELKNSFSAWHNQPGA